MAALVLCLLLSGALLVSAAAPSPQLHSVPLYLRDSPTPLGLSPAQPTKSEGTTSPIILGTPLLGVPLGTYRSQETNRAVAIEGQVGVSLYFVSKDNARNAWIEVTLLNNEAVLLELSSSNTKKDLSPTPTEITISGTVHAQLNQSAILSMQVVFHADLRPPSGINPLPQPADSRLLYDGVATPSHVSLTTELLAVTFELPTVDADADEVVFPFALLEIFPSGGGTITFTPQLKGPNGPIDVDNYVSEEVGPVNDGVAVQLTWSLANESHAKDGRYELLVTASYNDNGTFSNSSSYDLDLPTSSGKDNDSGIDLNQLIGPLVALAIGGAIVFFFIRRQRGDTGPGSGRHSSRSGKRRARPQREPQADEPVDDDEPQA